jgi:RNA polymerase sigma factor for flagellar operon FliA
MNHALETYSRNAEKQRRDAQVEEYLPLVHHVIGRLPFHLPASLDRDDLFGVGVLGLMHAAATYDASKGAAFKTHAYVNIRGAILDELRRHDVVPRSRRDRMRAVARAEADLRDALDRPPTPEEIARASGLTLEQVDDILVNAHGMTVLSVEEAAGGEGTSRLIESLRMPSSPDPGEEAAQRELKSDLARAIQDLPERERRVILLYYAEDLRLKEIGKIMGVSESRICQLHARAIYRLNQALSAGESRPGSGARGR